ncbi:alpha-amylase family glycosyl hydrolase [Mycoplasmopsis felis]|uniref:alpha-amylase family glycosyl hydrolase n=1 Tax=Mycoplasmopsis felis TaxID=33923 RepID=UPI002AF6B594|nr:alpha-amylase family glycosyl hydrolase [Mycoplasmopsis felis]WQQ01431.1 alpha-amylase family glycosyl hydrolase [Mycoplasmopsis felis]WQQ10725.1 alpha-amylase family glycosyl hydrolase [Mycoplasmopsis felis]
MKTVKLEDKILYQIFPRSFYDSNNDGDGDLKGITEKLPYLKELGINGIWLCPTYDTHFVDAGYDVLDYKSVWKQFGTLQDFKEMSLKASELGIDIIMDIVLNHVSNEHEWFKKASESENNIEHSYFIWRKELTEQEKQAQSIFGGSAWEYVDSVKKYYFHLFSKEQVDLNWSHPNTIAAMVDVINFWYDLGVRGFRLDAIKHVAKTFDNVQGNPYFAWCDGAVDFLKEFNKLAFSNKPDAYTLGEASGITAEELLEYGSGQNQVSQNYFNFAWWWIGWGKTGRNGYDANWNYKEFVYQQQPFQHNENIKPHMFTNFLSNHDTSRSVSRWGNEGIFREESAKAHALMLLTLKGIPCLYYGEEIGLLNTQFNSRNEFKDVDIHNGFKSLVDEQKIYSESEFIKYLNINSRDAGRSLMQWNNTINAGFNSGNKPWLNLGKNKEYINVENALKDKTSIFHFYKKLIDMRKNEYRDVFVLGKSEISLTENALVKISRTFNDTKLTVYINLTDKEVHQKINLGTQLLSTYKDQKNVVNVFRPYEGILIKE